MDAITNMNAITLLFAALCIFAIAYRVYGVFIAARLLRLDPNRVTPAHRLNNGSDYIPTSKGVLFGHHFAAIAAAGPLVGPVIAAQFGFLPGALWILIGCVLAGAVHDMVALFASVRHDGQSLVHIATKEIGPFTGTVAGFAVLFILLLSMAALSVVMVNALFKAPWSLFVVASTIPIALLMGAIMFYRKNSVGLATVIGILLLLLCIVIGHPLMQPDTFGWMFDWSIGAVSLSIPIYAFFASVLPVWLLLVPRDYLSTYLKLGTIGMLAIGIIFVQPTIVMPPLTEFTAGGGPIIGGPVLPFIFITIACGAISGFHSVIATGTTPKMISNEKEILFVGYGAMLVEGFVAIMALIAATTLMPGDYFAINALPDTYDKLVAANPAFFQTVDLQYFIDKIGIDLHGRTGGAVSLAVGMAHIFHKLPFMDTIIAYWYNFALLFEAVFILTAIDAGTRVGRYLLQEMFGRVIPKMGQRDWVPGSVFCGGLFSFCLGYLVYTGTIKSIWPLFGMSNQLLAASALIICTTVFMRMNRGWLCLITAIPGFAMVGITFWVGYLQIFGAYIPNGQWLLAILGIAVLLMVLLIVVGSIRKWIELSGIKVLVKDEFGDEVKELMTP